MKRFAYIEPQFNQLLFNETEGWLERVKDKVKWIEQIQAPWSDEEKTVRAIEKKYGIKLRWQEIDDGNRKWFGYVVE